MGERRAVRPSSASRESSKGLRVNARADLPSRADIEWDAGDLGCGELLLDLKIRLKGAPPGSLARIVARDPGAPADLPAWCALTGHRLVSAEPPTYWIRTKKEG